MADLEDILGGDWVAQQRDAGGAIMVMGLSGRIHHYDDAIKVLLRRDDLPTNAFDMIAPGHTLQASAMVARHMGRPVRGWFPMVDGNANPIWCRFHVTWPRRLLALAVWTEPDGDKHSVHAEPMD